MFIPQLASFLIAAGLMIDASPNRGSPEAQARRAIGAAISRSLKATRNNDIESFMASVPRELERRGR